MKVKIQSKKVSVCFIVFFSLLFSLGSHGQKLAQSRKSSYNTYIYKITEREAEKIYTKNVWKVDSSFFHTLVDTFPTDSQYVAKLPQGHYIKTFAEKNKQKFSITTIQDFDVFIFNNNTDLCIQVFDLQGKQISNADVNIGWKKLRFDKNTQSYLDKKSNEKGILKVTYQGFSAYYDLSRQYNNSFIKRGAKKLAYHTPLKYAWVPINYVVHLPIDGVKSIKEGYAQGSIRRSKYFFVRTYENVACRFTDDYCKPYYKFKNKHTGYLVFNKPKYLPGDTVKFKAYLLTKKGKPINKDVQVVLQNRGKDVELAKLAPYRSGGYSYQFHLHDSLQLQLDRYYRMMLRLTDKKEYISSSFKYEDYELSKNKLSLRVDNKEQFRGKEITLYAKGTDENDLNLMDARVEVLLTPSKINEYLESPAFVPNTLLFLEEKLDPSDETEIVLSDSIFPKANFEYEISVRLLTSDNESVLEKKNISYFYHSEKFDIDVKTNSIRFEYLKNGEAKPKLVSISSEDNFGNKTLVYEGETPCSVALNPYFSSYIVQADSISERVDISKKPSLIQCFSERTSDSIHIVVNNPRKIPFSYNIYKKNSEQAAGYTDSLSIQKKTSSKQSYFASIRYLWGGEVKEENFRIPLADKKLNVSVTQPKIVYPGQKSRIDILVTDTDGNPVEGADLTAYSLTKKFNYTAPSLPYLGKSPKGKSIINNFNFENFRLSSHPGLQLDYEAWRTLAGIDSIEYYKFVYPKNAIHRSEYNIADSIPQFAPFVVSKGAILPIHVIYVDGKPVYFSWSSNPNPYSFRIKSGYHQIKLRTTKKEITVDSLYFEKGKKLIFSLDENAQHPNIKIKEAEEELSISEKQLLHKYIVPYRSNFNEKYAYLEQGGNFQLLAPQPSYQRTFLAGPMVGSLRFQLVDGFSTNFRHEPFFEYEFSPSLLKMREVKSEKYPKKLNLYNSNYSFTDTALTREAIEKQWKNLLDSKRYKTARYRYPSSTSKGAGKLLINFNENDKAIADIPLNVLVFKYDNHEFLRIYPGNTKYIHDLSEGYYRVMFFYSEAKYHLVDSVFIQPNGLNYYEFEQALTLKKDTFSLRVSNIIEKTLFKPQHYDEKEKELKQIYNMYQQEFKYTGVGDVVEGYVYDADGNLPIPGATVIVKGTTYGCVTNIDGYFSIKVPPGNTMLNFSFIGYVSQDVPIGNMQALNVKLESNFESLDEVVVVGYGVTRKESLTGSVSTISSHGGILAASGNLSGSLSGRVEGISISPGSGVEIKIRGASTTSFEKTPLYIINGSVYTGDISELDPSIIENIEMLKDASATAIYGSQGANGVVIISTRAGAFKTTNSSQKGANYDEAFLEAASQSSSIRNNFSDYGFWQPTLITNKEGKATFELVFPDDVTSWKTFYLAMNNKKQSGQSEGLIKSYKPLMAQLSVPRFLVQGDTSQIIGKALNYMPNSVELATKFEVNGNEMLNSSRLCSNSVIDTLSLLASADSMELKYYLETKDGYFDGEQRHIPVFPKGIEVSKGAFYTLNNDTTIQLQFDSNLGAVSLYARADVLEVIEDEINQLINYKYLCNEQLASKLKALLAEKNIAYYKGVTFKNDDKIEKVIRLLEKNKKEKGLWGWWKNSEESLWISLHALESLMHAEQMGYKTSVNTNQLAGTLIWELGNTSNFYRRVRILKILNLLGSPIDNELYISDLDKTKNMSFNERLHIMELKQLFNMECSLDSLKPYKKSTLFGNTYYSDQNQATNLLNNDIQTTLRVYKLLKNDSANHTQTLNEIQNYLLENRKNGYWQNTYESAQIIETLLPALLQGKSEIEKPQLTFKGDLNKTINHFPFEMNVQPNQNIEVSKTGSFPIYFTAYQKYWDDSVSMKTGDFEISTSFDGKSSHFLAAGQETKLIAKVKVKKDAEYVMINIPIPGGCSYANKKSNFRHESHREYFKHETAIFCNYLAQGEYIFEIDLRARYSGTYTLNPAKVELMYFPTFNANNEAKTITIE